MRKLSLTMSMLTDYLLDSLQCRIINLNREKISFMEDVAILTMMLVLLYFQRSSNKSFSLVCSIKNIFYLYYMLFNQ